MSEGKKSLEWKNESLGLKKFFNCENCNENFPTTDFLTHFYKFSLIFLTSLKLSNLIGNLNRNFFVRCKPFVLYENLEKRKL